jgi:hypothetical protein
MSSRVHGLDVRAKVRVALFTMDGHGRTRLTENRAQTNYYGWG